MDHSAKMDEKCHVKIMQEFIVLIFRQIFQFLIFTYFDKILVFMVSVCWITAFLLNTGNFKSEYFMPKTASGSYVF